MKATIGIITAAVMVICNTAHAQSEPGHLNIETLVAQLGPASDLVPATVDATGIDLVKPAPLPVTDVSVKGTTLFGGARIANIYSLLQNPGKWTVGEWTTTGGILAAVAAAGTQTDWFGMAGNKSEAPPKQGTSGAVEVTSSGSAAVVFDNVTGGVGVHQERNESGSGKTIVTITQAP